MTNELEQHIRNAAVRLRAMQVCALWKIPSDLRLTKTSAVFGQRGPVDFMGHTTNGTALLIEAKMCRRKSLPVPSPGGIPGHQWITLRDAAASGAIALIVWQHYHHVSVLPFQEAEVLRGTRRSIPWTGGRSLEADDPTLVIVRALIEMIDLLGQPVDVRV